LNFRLSTGKYSNDLMIYRFHTVCPRRLGIHIKDTYAVQF